MDVVVVGGSNVDLMGTSYEDFLQEDSNPGSLHVGFGGVSRNVTENLARLGVKVSFITVLGTDTYGKAIKRELESLDVRLHALYAEKTPSYLALFNPKGMLMGAVAAMDAMATLTVDVLKKFETVIEEAKILVLDTNLSEEVLAYLFKHAKGRVYVDLISVNKGKKIRKYLPMIDTLKCNKQEAFALIGEESLSFEALKEYFSLEGVKRTFITDGEMGAYMLVKNHIAYHQAIDATLKNTSGAGDAFLAGVIYADLNRLNPLSIGLAAASLAVEAVEAVNKALSIDTLLKKTRSE